LYPADAFDGDESFYTILKADPTNYGLNYEPFG
jgi:hypothetical protein